MLCENCKENEANVKYTQVINGVKKQMNLCEKCARELGITDMSFDMPNIDFSNFVGSMFDDTISEFIPSLIKPETLLCDKCKSSYEDFIETGKFGCDECYETFENQIDNLLKNIHGVNKHIGRGSKMLKTGEKNITNKKEDKEKIKEENKEGKENKLEELKERLKKEIKEERYEDAAKTRDQIKKLEE